MNRLRYESYVAARDAIERQPLDPHAAEVLNDLAEGLLLARDPVEAERMRDAAHGAFELLVARCDLTRRGACRFWAHLKACGPPMHWAPSWDRSPVPFEQVLRGS